MKRAAFQLLKVRAAAFQKRRRFRKFLLLEPGALVAFLKVVHNKPVLLAPRPPFLEVRFQKPAVVLQILSSAVVVRLPPAVAVRLPAAVVVRLPPAVVVRLLSAVQPAAGERAS